MLGRVGGFEMTCGNKVGDDNTRPYRFGFNGQERDDEVSGDGNSTTAEFWQYDARLGRRFNIDPKGHPSISYYACFANNPIGNKDTKGDTIQVTTSDGKNLFRLDDGKKELLLKTAKEVYAEGTQWFEPLADNYMPLLEVDKELTSRTELKHFSWQDIVDFSTVDRNWWDYQSGWSGDWKSSKKGADGYLLVTVDGKPYWADAIGQIPFAVDQYHDMLQKTGSYTKSIVNTVQTGIDHADGGIFSNPDYSNTYDTYFVLRGAPWAGQYYLAGEYSWWTNEYSTPTTSYSPVYLGYSISLNFKDQYLSKLKSNKK